MFDCNQIVARKQFFDVESKPKLEKGSKKAQVLFNMMRAQLDKMEMFENQRKVLKKFSKLINLKVKSY